MFVVVWEKWGIASWQVVVHGLCIVLYGML